MASILPEANFLCSKGHQVKMLFLSEMFSANNFHFEIYNNNIGTYYRVGLVEANGTVYIPRKVNLPTSDYGQDVIYIKRSCCISFDVSTVLDKSIWRFVRGAAGVRELKIST